MDKNDVISTNKLLKSKKRPNILFAIMDDASHMGAYGHKFVNTPNFDWVASKGILFNNAYTTNPKCAPSRASICTGMHTWQLEEACCHDVITFPSSFKTFPELLSKGGYHVGYTGKGWGPGNWQETRKWNPAGPCYNKYKLTPPERTNISDCDYAENFRYFLKEKGDDQPFYFWYGGFEPHRHYVPGEGRRHGKSIDNIQNLPIYWPNDDIVKEDLLDYAYEIDYFDLQLGKILNILREQDELDNTIIVVTSDNGCPFPRVKGQMYHQDFNLPLAICYPRLNNGGREEDSFISFTDFAPTFMEAAGLKLDEQFSGKSFYSQIVSTDRKQSFEGREFVTMGRENHDSGRKGDVGYPVRCIRKGEYLYVRNFEPNRWPAGNPETFFGNCDGSPTKDLILDMYDEGNHVYYDFCFGKRPLEELFNIDEDPDCVNNLADLEIYNEVCNNLWHILESYLKETNDPRVIGKGYIFDKYVVDKYQKDNSSWQAYVEGRFELPLYMDWEKFKL